MSFREISAMKSDRKNIDRLFRKLLFGQAVKAEKDIFRLSGGAMDNLKGRIKEFSDTTMKLIVQNGSPDLIKLICPRLTELEAIEVFESTENKESIAETLFSNINDNEKLKALIPYVVAEKKVTNNHCVFDRILTILGPYGFLKYKDDSRFDILGHKECPADLFVEKLSKYKHHPQLRRRLPYGLESNIRRLFEEGEIEIIRATTVPKSK